MNNFKQNSLHHVTVALCHELPVGTLLSNHPDSEQPKAAARFSSLDLHHQSNGQVKMDFLPNQRTERACDSDVGVAPARLLVLNFRCSGVPRQVARRWWPQIQCVRRMVGLAWF